MVLIHGRGCAWQWWLRVMRTVAAHGRMIAVDLAGFGACEPIADEDDGFQEHVGTIVGLLDHLGLAKAIIVGRVDRHRGRDQCGDARSRDTPGCNVPLPGCVGHPRLDSAGIDRP